MDTQEHWRDEIRAVTLQGEERLLGFDEHGVLMDCGTVMRRLIRDDYKAEARWLFGQYERLDLARLGIIETQLLDDGNLQHRKLITSYPFEWPASMYKDAVEHHLRLFRALEAHNLTLKDAIPSNIVFDNTEPILVDFLSLVRRDQLWGMDWLGGQQYLDPRFAVFSQMIMPHLLLPLLFMVSGRYNIARDLLSDRSCHCGGSTVSFRELVAVKGQPRRLLFRYLAALELGSELLCIRALSRKGVALSFGALTAYLMRRVQRLDVTPRSSSYSAYYSSKGEETPIHRVEDFTPKQLGVLEVIRDKQPRVVLDLGANTGWYSRLCAQFGARVIALEEDESCVDILYLAARAEKSAILPIRATVGDLTIDRCVHDGHALYRAGVHRFGADMVLALGLFHHLTLGEGRAIEDIFDVLARLAQSTLVLEFVSLRDAKIVDTPSFFPHRHQFSLEEYNIQSIGEVGLRHFRSVKQMASHPATRTLLVFEK